MNQLAGQSCLSIAQMLSGTQTPPAQLEMIRKMTCGARTTSDPVWENCWAALAEAEGEGRVERVIEQLMASPLLADGQAWELGESVIAAVVAGQDVPVEDVQGVVERLQEEMPRRLPVMAGTAIDPDQSDALAVVLMIARPMAWAVEEEPVAEPVAAPAKTKSKPALRSVPAVAPAVPAGATTEIPAASQPESGEDAEPTTASSGDLFGPDVPAQPGRRKGGRQNYFAEQEELPLNQKVDKGRFENSSPTVMNGEDLDVPTFMRMGVRIQARI
jgi:cell division protein FtsZ